MKNIDKELESAAKKMVKGKKASPKVEKPKEPTDAMGWLKKANIDSDPKASAPMVGKIGYV